MNYQVQTVLGPKTSQVKRADALEQLQTHPEYPKNAILADFEDKGGQWVATLKVPEASTKEAAPPPFAKETPAEAGPPELDGPPKDDGGEDSPSDEKPDEKEEGPPKAEGEEGDALNPKKPSVEEAVSNLTHLVQQIADALGVAGPGHPGAGPEVGGPPAPPGGGPPAGGRGPGRPPSGPAGQSAMMRARPLKPGDAPNSPGVTPVGAPAFASTAVPDDHPWKNTIGRVATFSVANPIPDDEPSEGLTKRAKAELSELAEPFGYHARQIREGRDEDGNRVVRALISRH